MTSTNTLKVAALMAALTALLGLIGFAIGGTFGIIFALGFSVLMNFGAYWFSDKIALRMARAHPVTREDAPQLYNTVERLAGQAGIPTPRVYVIEANAPNAFATGRNPEHGVVAVSTGMLGLLNQEELEGVIAHELGHIKRRDTLIAAIAATIAGAITSIAAMLRWALIFGGSGRRRRGGEEALATLLLIIIAPIAAVAIQLAISRAREYDADAESARITGNPLALASALDKLDVMSGRTQPLPSDPSTASLFIVNPLRGGASQALAGLFSTHPPIHERINRLNAMVGRF